MKAVNELTPNIVGSTSQPFYGAPPSVEYIGKGQRKKYVTTLLDAKVPKLGQETLEHFMNTEHEMDLVNVGEFFRRLDDANEPSFKAGIYHELGHVEIKP